MFVTDKLIYLQLPKTGSTAITRVLSDVVGGKSHKKHSRVPKGFDIGDRRVIGSIRNPWDWYVSLWAYGCTRRGSVYRNLTKHRGKYYGFRSSPQTAFRYLLNEFRKPVKTWEDTYRDVKSPERFRKWLLMLNDHDRYYDIRERYADSPVSTLAGFQTYRYLHLYTDNVLSLYRRGIFAKYDDLFRYNQEHNLLDGIVRMESLARDLIDQIEKSGVSLDTDVISRIILLERENATERERDLDYYYDPETIDLVYRRERLIVDKFGYDYS